MLCDQSSTLALLTGVQASTDHTYGAPVVYVDYESVESLTAALKGIHTVISVMNTLDPSVMIAHHSVLLKACLAAHVSRFAPADFSLGPASHSTVDVLRHKDTLLQLCEEMGVKKGLECASFQNGMFMNYFAQGKTFADADKTELALAGLVDDFMVEYIDVPHGRLVIPLDERGQPSQTTVTHIQDIGKFVAAAVDFPPGQWKGSLGMAGDTCSFQEVADLLRAKGVHLRHETITAQQCDERIRAFDEQLAKGFNLQAFKGKMVAQMVRVQCEGQVDSAVIKPTLNKLCPEVNPIKTWDYIERVY